MGTERFSEYEGYGKTFTFKGNFDDNTLINRIGRMGTDILAIDASLCFPPTDIKYYEQYTSDRIQRELDKLYVGTKKNIYSELENDAFVATGNWGCGAFHGNMELKALLQVIAISVSGKNIYYCAFNEMDFAVQLGSLIKALKKKHINTDTLYNFIESYNSDIISKVTLESPPNITLFNYILEKLNSIQ